MNPQSHTPHIHKGRKNGLSTKDTKAHEVFSSLFLVAFVSLVDENLCVIRGWPPESK
jgi:hypothetical protein